MNVGTASYDDNRRMLRLVYDHHCAVQPAVSHVFVIGDEQTFERMMKIKQAEPMGYEWLIPMPGDFHFTAHTMHAEFRLNWRTVLHPLLVRASKEDKFQEDWLMGVFNKHEVVFTTIVEAVYKWFEKLFPELMDNPILLRDRCAPNMTATFLFEFLFGSGLPYLWLRRLFRLSPSKERRQAFHNFLVWQCWRFRTVNKYQYAMLCIQTLYVWNRLSPEYQNIYCDHFTMSMKGHEGRCIPIDHGQEKVNKAGKQLMDGTVTEEMVLHRIPWLNCIWPLEKAWFAFTADPDARKLHDTRPDMEADVNNYLAILLHAAGDTPAAATAPTNACTLSGGRITAASLPSNRITAFNTTWAVWVNDRMSDLTF